MKDLPLSPPPGRYRPIDRRTIRQRPEWRGLDPELREAVEVISAVLPFRTNAYVMERLIDWAAVPGDPIYQLTFPQPGMLSSSDYETMRSLLRSRAPAKQIRAQAAEIRSRLNPQPGGQLTHNVARIGDRVLPGLQHKYRETVLYFPSQGQTCHAYCTYCFRWAQFVDLPRVRLGSRGVEELVEYLELHPEVSDVLLTGGDPAIMRTALLGRLLEPLLSPRLESLRTIRIGTKAPAYWPQRFLSDPDADDLLRLFERVVASGRHLAIMAHYSHPVELSTPEARRAVARIRATGALIRMQAPLVRHVNDRARDWASLWQTGVELGLVPYYMFVERDTGPKRYFEVPLARAYRIFSEAYTTLSGLARSVRGPVMSAFPGKVRLLGVSNIQGKKVFVLDFLQARDPSWGRRPFFATFDPRACWLDDLKPLGGDQFFFEAAQEEEEEGEAAIA